MKLSFISLAVYEYIYFFNLEKACELKNQLKEYPALECILK